VALSSNRSVLSGALAGLANSYNSVRDQVRLQVGENAGLLSGDFIVRETQARLRGLAGYSGEGAIQGLADLGFEFDESGEMTFDSSKFYSLPESSFGAALDFLGSSTSGFGLLANDFEAISDPVAGMIRTQQNQYDVADRRLTEQIDALAERIGYMQRTMSLKLQQADVLLASLASQQTMLEASIEGLNLTTYGKKDG